MNIFRLIITTFLITKLAISCKDRVRNKKRIIKNRAENKKNKVEKKEKIILKKNVVDINSIDSIERIYGHYYRIKNKEKIILKGMSDKVESLELFSSDSIKRFYGNFFSYNLLREKISIEKVKEILSKDNSYSLFEKEINSVLVDSSIKMFKLSSRGTEFIFIKFKNKEFLESAKISKNNFTFKKDIHIGISKKDFFKKINKNIVNENIIEITDTEEYSFFIFYFKDNLLNKIIITHNIEY